MQRGRDNFQKVIPTPFPKSLKIALASGKLANGVSWNFSERIIIARFFGKRPEFATAWPRFLGAVDAQFVGGGVKGAFFDALVAGFVHQVENEARMVAREGFEQKAARGDNGIDRFRRFGRGAPHQAGFSDFKTQGRRGRAQVAFDDIEAARKWLGTVRRANGQHQARKLGDGAGAATTV